jgi:hypothetical protein
MKQPTADDWVIARLLMFAFDGGRNKAAYTNYDFVKSVLYLYKRVGSKQAGEMFETLREEGR